jgi:hypothetical protein
MYQGFSHLVHVPFVIRKKSLNTGNMLIQKEAGMGDISDGFPAFKN